METILHKLASALSASEYPVADDDVRLVPLAVKLKFLQVTGRYAKLLSELFSANHKANVQSLILEATFAFQFERMGKSLAYEVSQRADNETTIDFHRALPSERNLFIEMRLVQQRQWVAGDIAQQLQKSGAYEVTFDGGQDQSETVRLQQLILSKAQAKDGRLIKFARDSAKSCNVIAVEVSELHLGMIDHADCVLVTYGDPAVALLERREIFGLFQEDNSKHPQHLREYAAKFQEFRHTVHAVLFLWKIPRSSPVNFDLEFLLICNRALMSKDDKADVMQDLCGALAQHH